MSVIHANAGWSNGCNVMQCHVLHFLTPNLFSFALKTKFYDTSIYRKELGLGHKDPPIPTFSSDKVLVSCIYRSALAHNVMFHTQDAEWHFRCLDEAVYTNLFILYSALSCSAFNIKYKTILYSLGAYECPRMSLLKGILPEKVWNYSFCMSTMSTDVTECHSVTD